ncbi:MAG: tRNA glutamyl-Q(34) synthetase GluQRS [Alphaproteobacteria bacterium]
MASIISRFAPSPNGYLHFGHAYSALLAWRAAQGDSDRFLLRIEDIDTWRARPKFEQAIFDDLAWLGLHWEEPVRRQSEHMDDYAVALDRLKDRDLLYPCFCTRRDIQAEIDRSRSAPHGPEGFLYPGTCRNLSDAERGDRIADGEPHAMRLDTARAVEQVGALSWTDRKAGEIKADPESLGDVVLARKDTPTSYHLAVTVDDALQEVTLVTRGLDLFHATHIHRLLQALLDLPTPEYRHHRLIRDESGERMAKRRRSETLGQMRDRGVSADEVIARVDAIISA